MTSLNSYTYRERQIFDIQTLVQAIIFIVSNVILSIIFLFLTMEEIDWTIYRHRNGIREKEIDNTSWNLRTLFLSLVKICPK